MVMIVKKGKLPATPHTEFCAIPKVLALEEIHGSYGFSGPWSRKLHVRSYPTEQVKTPAKADFHFVPKLPKEAEILQPYHILTGEMPAGGNALHARKNIVFGPRTAFSILKPTSGFPEGDHLPDRFEIETGFFLADRIDLSDRLCPHYFNSGGQATLMSPVIETEIKTPELTAPIDQRGEFPIFAQHDGGRVTKITLGHHPFVFDIHNHHGIEREKHTAPPVHQTFQAGNVPNNGFSLCSFVPRMEGWHPKEVPAPYAHYNVDSDECMLFCNASYGVRKGVIQPGSFTFHPGGTPHSPQGPAALKSLASRGKLSTRLAVMCDTYFKTLAITQEGFAYADKNYPLSWNENLWKESKNQNGWESVWE